MRIGVPKEIKPQENRIGLTPDSVKTLVSEGHEGIVENTYTLKILNKSQIPLHFDIDLINLDYPEIKLPKKILIGAGVMQEVPITLAIDGELLKKKSTDISFAIQSVEQPDIQLQKSTVFFRN